MSIQWHEARVGFHVFYQQPHMKAPEYGVITSLGSYVFVRFGSDTTSKACHPRDLFWPPNYCSIDGCNPEGQPWSNPADLPSSIG